MGNGERLSSGVLLVFVRFNVSGGIAVSALGGMYCSDCSRSLVGALFG
jgi:hypothetical protein